MPQPAATCSGKATRPGENVNRKSDIGEVWAEMSRSVEVSMNTPLIGTNELPSRRIRCSPAGRGPAHIGAACVPTCQYARPSPPRRALHRRLAATSIQAALPSGRPVYMFGRKRDRPTKRSFGISPYVSERSTDASRDASVGAWAVCNTCPCPVHVMLCRETSQVSRRRVLPRQSSGAVCIAHACFLHRRGAMCASAQTASTTPPSLAAPLA